MDEHTPNSCPQPPCPADSGERAWELVDEFYEFSRPYMSRRS